MPFRATRQRKQTVRQRLVVPTIAIVLLGYFGFHALNGEFGLVGRARIDREIAELEATLATVRAEREGLAHRVTQLRPESLDPDMIDERARQSLNLVHPDELAILRPGHVAWK